MVGDTAEAAAVRAAADRLQASARAVRDLARWSAVAGVVDWHSDAAARFRARLDEEVARLQAGASTVDGAAAALRAHARAVEEATG